MSFDLVVDQPASRFQQAFTTLGLAIAKPTAAFTRRLDGGDVAALFLILMAINFVLSIAMTPAYAEAFRQGLGSRGAVTSSAMATGIGMAIVGGSLISVAIFALMALLFTFAFYALSGRCGYGESLGVLIVAGAPLLIDRVVRLAAHYAGLTSDLRDNPLDITTLLPAGLPPPVLSIVAMFSPFDIWTFVLVLIGFRLRSGLSPLRAFLVSALLWGGMQVFFVRLQLDGVIGQ